MVRVSKKARPPIQAHGQHAGNELAGGVAQLGAGGRVGDNLGRPAQMLHRWAFRVTAEEARREAGPVERQLANPGPHGAGQPIQGGAVERRCGVLALGCGQAGHGGHTERTDTPVEAIEANLAAPPIIAGRWTALRLGAVAEPAMLLPPLPNPTSLLRHRSTPPVVHNLF